MKRKINIQLLVLVFIAMSTTLTMAIGVFYNLFQKEILADLKSYTHIIGNSGVFLEKTYTGTITDQSIRVTVIDKDGNVYYDSMMDKNHMDNHNSRPEVMDAIQYGEGEDIRLSKTIKTNAFYYAIRLDNGMILRTAKEVDSVVSVFKKTFPVIGLLAVIVFAICVGLAHFMTKSLITPIEQLAEDTDSYNTLVTYKELVPFIHTIQKQHEDIIRSANMRQEFTANVSHELKTPLTAISGYAELIESGMANAKDIHHFAGEIHQNSKRLLTLIDDIIQLSELDTTEVEVSFEKIDLYEIAKSSFEMLKITANQVGIELKLEGEPCEICGNKAMIEEVIMNLCDNAIRYNNKNGKVLITVKPVNNEAILSVKDTGIGISKENQQRIFERFYRVDKSRSKSTGGTGLGLAIVKHIVVKHNAHMEVKSEIGQGTEIKVVFKLGESNK